MAYRHEAKITKYDYGSYLTAILAYLMTRQQDMVGLTTFDSEVRMDMPCADLSPPFQRDDAATGRDPSRR